ncbi:undecaprenyl-diphosphate phosphatase [Anaerocolumna sp. AGMB13025]|uniref:undecaprenyl-diphosphate phosphatase n=1 Tax=Anaerocolumna sp. AGMB13025 TaxID=3039116 RepID=UPI00241E3783|nr:undecaprenyl-diphosphate phosphatase [Anaerocolumna sp. AGMB13025]WFR59725.1 undecaprenyl-diphosphate phosphatase [Anaerocolumna sp. AGMB13025]
MDFFEILKVIFLGIVEGITEWLPISSTGHMILVDEIMPLNLSPDFKEVFFIVIQFGAILAVILLFWNKIFPFNFKKDQGPFIKMDIMTLWIKIAIACLPAIIMVLLFDDIIDKYFYNYITVAITLVVYGILFIVIENINKHRKPVIRNLSDLTYKTAFMIGLFQLLSLIPGTSRSGATILGAIIIGTSRYVAAEFSFFLAIPAMFGYSLLKMLKFGLNFQGNEIMILILGMLSAFVVSVFAIRFLMGFVKKHDFKVFGYYRIVLGVLVVIYFLATGK